MGIISFPEYLLMEGRSTSIELTPAAEIGASFPKYFLLLFILGVSIGSNSLIVNNLGKFGWQAIVLAVSGVLGSLIAARLVLQLFFRKGGE